MACVEWLDLLRHCSLQHLARLKPEHVVYDERQGRVSGGKKAFIAAAIERQRQNTAEVVNVDPYSFEGEAGDSRVARLEDAIVKMCGGGKPEKVRSW